jgi:hypothetical protein
MFEYILSDAEQFGYDHLFPGLHSLMLVLTVLGILLVQFVAICALEWRNVASEGLGLFEKLINYFWRLTHGTLVNPLWICQHLHGYTCYYGSLCVHHVSTFSLTRYHLEESVVTSYLTKKKLGYIRRVILI